MITVQNPNWPLIDVAVCYTAGPSDLMPPNYWSSVKNRTMGSLTTSRGRQYELDQVQTGTWTGSLENTDAALDPSNASSPFYPKVVPYRSFRHRAQYPATVNILTADQANAGLASSLPLGTLPQWTGNSFPSDPMTITTGAGSGTNFYQLSYVASNTNGDGMFFTGFTVQPGVPHSFQCRALSTANNGLQMKMGVTWINASGGFISTTVGTVLTMTTATQVLSVSATAPTNATGALVQIVSANTVAPATVVQIDHLQAEYAAAPTSYVLPGKWYSIFTGYVERWPQSWTKNGQFGMSNLTCVDAFGWLSQRKLLSSAYEEVLALNPTWFYPLDESAPAQPSIPALFYDLTANRSPLGISNGTPPPTALATPGTGLTATGGWLPQGAGGPTFGLPDTTVGSPFSAQYLDLTQGGKYAAGPATSSWTRMFAFRTPQKSGAAGTGYFFRIGNNAVVGQQITIFGNYDGSTGNFGGGTTGYGLTILVYQNGVNTAELAVNASVLNNMSDGGWHFLLFGSSGTTIKGWYDGNPMYVGASGYIPFAVSQNIEKHDDFAGLSIAGPPYGEVAVVAEFPMLLTDAQASALYSAFRYGGSGLGVASSGTRYQDILRWGNWRGLQSVDTFTTGETNAYGPATEMNAPASSQGTDVVSMLQTVVDTDSGSHYVAADGTITFKSRRSRYNQGTPSVIFGENTGAGEIPYTNVSTGYDPTRIANDISTNQTQTSATQRVIDTTSTNAYGDIQLTRTLNTLSPLEQLDAAQYLARRNAQPVQRVEGISVDVGANPTSAIWTAMLGLELGARVRVMRRPPLGAATIQVDGFLEQINWSFDDKGNASADLQISVNNNQQYWQLDSSTYSVLDSTTVIGY